LKKSAGQAKHSTASDTAYIKHYGTFYNTSVFKKQNEERVKRGREEENKSGVATMA
jgi:hypothetical protein